MITRTQAASLAMLLANIRSDWQPKSIMTLLEKNHEKFEFPTLAQAAVNAAVNPANRTPAIIFLPGPHWDGQTNDGSHLTSSERRLNYGRKVAEQAANRQPTPNPFETSEFDIAQNKLLALPDCGDELLQQVKTEHPEATPAERIKLAAQTLGR